MPETNAVIIGNSPITEDLGALIPYPYFEIDYRYKFGIGADGLPLHAGMLMYAFGAVDGLGAPENTPIFNYELVNDSPRTVSTGALLTYASVFGPGNSFQVWMELQHSLRSDTTCFGASFSDGGCSCGHGKICAGDSNNAVFSVFDIRLWVHLEYPATGNRSRVVARPHVGDNAGDPRWNTSGCCQPYPGHVPPVGCDCSHKGGAFYVAGSEHTGSGTTVTTSIPIKGNVLILWVSTKGGAYVNHIDQADVIWYNLTNDISPAGPVVVDAELWAGVATATLSGPQTAVLSLVGPASQVAWCCREFGGLDIVNPQDGAGVGAHGSGVSVITGSITPGTRADLILVCEGHSHGTGPTVQPTGMTACTFAASGADVGVQGNYKLDGSAGSQSAAWTLPTTSPVATWATGAIALRALVTPADRSTPCGNPMPYIPSMSGEICFDDGFCNITRWAMMYAVMEEWHTSGISFGSGPALDFLDFDYIPIFPDCNRPPCATLGMAYAHQLGGIGGVVNPYTGRYDKYELIDGSLPPGLRLHEVDDYPGLVSVTILSSDSSFASPGDIGGVLLVEGIGVGDGTGATLIIDTVDTGTGTVTAVHVGLPGTKYHVGERYKACAGTNCICIQVASVTPMAFQAGQIYGTPTRPGPFPFVFRVTDYWGQWAQSPAVGLETECWIGVCDRFAVVPSLYCGDPPTGHCGVPYAWVTHAEGGEPPYTYRIPPHGGRLPPGLRANTDSGFAVSGTPRAGGIYNFTIEVTDSVGAIFYAHCRITICDCSAVSNFVF